MVDSSIAQQDCHSRSHCGFRRFRLSIPTAPILMPRTANINQFWLVVSETKNVITKDIGIMGAEWVQNDPACRWLQMVADGWRLGSLDSLPALSGPFRSELLSPKVTSQTRVAVNEGFLTRKDKRLCVNLRILKTYGFFFHFSC